MLGGGVILDQDLIILPISSKKQLIIMYRLHE